MGSDGGKYVCPKCGGFVNWASTCSSYNGTRWQHWDGYCPKPSNPPASEVVTVDEPTPIQIVIKIRPFCRPDGTVPDRDVAGSQNHGRCSGVQAPYEASNYYIVCSCECHTPTKV